MNHEALRHDKQALQFRDAEMRSELTMRITISVDNVTPLRHLIIGRFGENVAFMRIQSIDHAKKMNVCLCLTAPIIGRVKEEIMQMLPCTEFGRTAFS